MNIKLVFLVIVVSTISATLTSALFITTTQPDIIAIEKNQIPKTVSEIDTNNGRANSNSDSEVTTVVENEVIVIPDDLVKSGTPIEGISPEHQAILTKLETLYAEYDALIASNQPVPAELKANLENTKQELLDFINSMEPMSETL